MHDQSINVILIREVTQGCITGSTHWRLEITDASVKHFCVFKCIQLLKALSKTVTLLTTNTCWNIILVCIIWNRYITPEKKQRQNNISVVNNYQQYYKQSYIVTLLQGLTFLGLGMISELTYFYVKTETWAHCTSLKKNPISRFRLLLYTYMKNYHGTNIYLIC